MATMDFITVKSIGGSIWSFRKDRIEIVMKRFSFQDRDVKQMPELRDRDECSIIKLIGQETEFFCEDSYDSIMSRLTNTE